jgi:anti-anti-sigma factor
MNVNRNQPPFTMARDGRTYALVHERVEWADVLSAFGEFDLSVADELQAAIDERLNGGGPLVLDMEFCDYLDSTILSVLVRSMRVWGWRMAIVVPSAARIRRIFELTRLDDALPIFANRDEARLRLTPCP